MMNKTMMRLLFATLLFGGTAAGQNVYFAPAGPQYHHVGRAACFGPGVYRGPSAYFGPTTYYVPRVYYGPNAFYGPVARFGPAYYGYYGHYGPRNYLGFPRFPTITYSATYYGPSRYYYVPRRLAYGAHIAAHNAAVRAAYPRPPGVARVTARPGSVTRTFRATRR